MRQIFSKHFNNLRLKWQLIILYAMVIVIIVFFVGIYLTRSLVRIIRTTSMEYYTNSLDTIVYNLKAKGTKIDYITDLLRMDKSLQTLIYDTDSIPVGEYFKCVDYFFNLNKSIELIDADYVYRVYHRNTDSNISAKLITTESTPCSADASQYYDKGVEPAGWFAARYSLESSDMDAWVKYSIIRGSNAGYKVTGVIMTYIRLATLKSILYINENTAIEVFAQNGDLIYADGPVTQRLANTASIALDGADYTYFENRIEGTGTSFDGIVVACLAPTSDMNGKIMRTLLTAGTATVIGIIMASLVVSLYINALNRRLLGLTDIMKQLGEGKYGIQIDEGGKDEIGMVYSNFNAMSSALNSAVSAYVEAEIEKQEAITRFEKSKAEISEARLLALQRQIDPHYLYNTLESIRMGLILKGDRETANVIMDFAAGFQSLIHDNEMTVEVVRELKLAKNYINVLKYRYDNLNFKIKVRDYKLYKFRIPAFSIQPIVENAVMHGIMGKSGSGIIKLDIKMEDGVFSICVSDNGRGMSEDEIAELWKRIRNQSSGETRGVALRNLYTRYKLIYSDRFEFVIQSKKNYGSLFEIRIHEDENGHV